MFSRTLHRLAALLGSPRIIYDRAGVSPYLSRWYLLGAPKASDGKPVFNSTGNPRDGITWNDRKGPVAIYLHKFHRGDDDEETHNHPWLWSVAIILSGGYYEYRLGNDNQLHRRTFLPGMINLIRGNDFHRVDLVGNESWSLFIAGPRVSSWGFWDRKERRCVPWREFIARKRGQTVQEMDES
jgi:hypothetical protein